MRWKSDEEKRRQDKQVEQKKSEMMNVNEMMCRLRIYGRKEKIKNYLQILNNLTHGKMKMMKMMIRIFFPSKSWCYFLLVHGNKISVCWQDHYAHRMREGERER